MFKCNKHIDASIFSITLFYIKFMIIKLVKINNKIDLSEQFAEQLQRFLGRSEQFRLISSAEQLHLAIADRVDHTSTPFEVQINQVCP